jgi:hypothetical protein
VTAFWGEKFHNSLKICPNFFLPHLKNKIIYNFVTFVATKKRYEKKIFSPLSLLLFLDPGSGMGKNQDPGSAKLPETEGASNQNTQLPQTLIAGSKAFTKIDIL